MLLSGCFMAPLALIGPATSGFTTASFVQSGVSAGANYMIKKSTGKTIGEHAIEAINENVTQTYLPEKIKISSKEDGGKLAKATFLIDGL